MRPSSSSSNLVSSPVLLLAKFRAGGETQPLAGSSIGRKLAYASKILPSYAWQRFTRRVPRGRVHLIICIADHFEPAYNSHGEAAPYDEQERRMEDWCRDYSVLRNRWRDNEGRPLIHTYFYPAEQYDRGLLEHLAGHCHAGWGEIEVHLHHGVDAPDTAENTRRVLAEFRDRLAALGCLSQTEGSGFPQYAFVHGNFALANSNLGRGCGVDSELQLLAETGCYADLTLPTNPFHPAQTARINSVYECRSPLSRPAAHRHGSDLQRGRPPSLFPIMIQGPLLVDLRPRTGSVGIENGALTGASPPTLRRLELWKRAAIAVRGRPDWLFIKLHTHGMDSGHREALVGAPMARFLQELLEGAEERGEILHFVTARELVNIALAACDGREGNPGHYRDYRFKLKVK